MRQSGLIVFVIIICSYCSFSQSNKHKFKQGEKLPELNLTDAFGDSVITSRLKGKKILLTFNRYVSCPLCNYRTHELLEHYDTLKANGLIILSVYESSKETLIEYTTKEQVPFFMIPDPKQVLYAQFKVRKSWWRLFRGLFVDYNRKHSAGKKLFKSTYKKDGSMNRIGADFLIDEKGIIQAAYYGKFVGDHLSIEEIVKWVLKK
jgi:thioredoxin-dependent peroxiredoxin